MHHEIVNAPTKTLRVFARGFRKKQVKFDSGSNLAVEQI